MARARNRMVYQETHHRAAPLPHHRHPSRRPGRHRRRPPARRHPRRPRPAPRPRATALIDQSQVSAALLPLVPGLALYNGLLQVVGTSPETANPREGGSTLLVALGVPLIIADSATLGTYLGRPIADQLRHIPTRPRRRRPSVAAEPL